MKFEVKRVSDWEQKQAPCKEAIKEDGSWFVEIKDLEDLISFKQKYGQLILRNRFDKKSGNMIYIYDDYLE